MREIYGIHPEIIGGKMPLQCLRDAPALLPRRSQRHQDAITCFESSLTYRPCEISGFHNSWTHFGAPPLASKAPGHIVDVKSFFSAALGRSSSIQPLVSTALRSRRASRSLAKTGSSLFREREVAGGWRMTGSAVKCS